jgi:hypothetical protein
VHHLGKREDSHRVRGRWQASDVEMKDAKKDEQSKPIAPVKKQSTIAPTPRANVRPLAHQMTLVQHM